MPGKDKEALKKVQEALKKIQLDPPDCVNFEGKLDQKQKKIVTVTNNSESIITFKCKVTSPDHIKIRPGYAFVKPNDKIVIQINVSPLNNRPRAPVSERLVVLFGVAPADHPPNPMNMWRGSLIPKEPLRVVIAFKFAGVEEFKEQSPNAQQIVKEEEKKQKEEEKKPKHEKKLSKSPSAANVVKQSEVQAANAKQPPEQKKKVKHEKKKAKSPVAENVVKKPEVSPTTNAEQPPSKEPIVKQPDIPPLVEQPGSKLAEVKQADVATTNADQSKQTADVKQPDIPAENNPPKLPDAPTIAKQAKNADAGSQYCGASKQ